MWVPIGTLCMNIWCTGQYVHNMVSMTQSLTCRYASLYFCVAIDPDDNELITLEIIHRYVELLDKYFGSVSSGMCVLS